MENQKSGTLHSLEKRVPTGEWEEEITNCLQP